MLRFRKKELAVTAGVVAALAAAVTAAVIYISNKDSVVIRQPVLFSQMGEETVYTGKTKLIYEEKDMYLQGEASSNRLVLLGAPVYMVEEEKLVLSQVMSYTSPDSNTLKKVNYFATVSHEGELCAISVDGKKRSDVKDGYLFDGKNSYIFLEPMTVTVGEETWDMEPLSYITVVNKQYFYYYSAGDKTSGYQVNTGEKVMARNQQGTYALNLSSDLLEPSNRNTQMLIPNPEILDLIQ